MFSLFDIIGLLILLAIGIAFMLVVAAVILGAILFVVMCFLTYVYLPLKERKQRRQGKQL